MDKLHALRYRGWRPHIWTGDIIEWQSNSFLGKMISEFTGKDVNHTGLIMRFSSFDTERVYTLEALAKGVYPNLLSRRLEEHDGQVYWLQLKSRYDDYRPAIAREAMKYVGIGYDYKSLFKQFLSRVSTEVDSFFCSELAYVALKEAGLPVKMPYAPQPGEFCNLGIFKTRIRIF